MISIIEEYESNANINVKINLEQIRLINYHTVAVHNSKIRKPKQLYKLPWETDNVKILTKEEFDSLIQKFGIPD